MSVGNSTPDHDDDADQGDEAGDKCSPGFHHAADMLKLLLFGTTQFGLGLVSQWVVKWSQPRRTRYSTRWRRRSRLPGFGSASRRRPRSPAWSAASS